MSCQSFTRRLMVFLLTVAPLLFAEITIKNSSSFVGNGRWQWLIYIEGTPAELDNVKCVEYRLHPTFPHPIQEVCERGRGEPFALRGNGWGEFEVEVRITFMDRRKQLYKHWLKLTDTRQPQLCDVAQSQLLEEGEVWALKDSLQGFYIYVDEIHDSKPSDVVIFNTSRSIDTSEANWDAIKERLKKTKAQLLGREMRKELSIERDELVVVRLQGKRALRLFVSYPIRHSSLQVSVCR